MFNQVLPKIAGSALIFATLILLKPIAAGAIVTQESAYKASSDQPHQVRVITSGLVALKTYLELIESAQTSIDVETFAIKSDNSGKLILKALMKKAAEGKRVRILLDKYGDKSESKDLDQLIKNGVEIRYYNESKFSLLPVDHRKLLIIDNFIVLTGGRNISDDNFNLTHKSIRLDYSVVVRGEIAGFVSKTFDRFWNSKMSSVRSVSFFESFASAKDIAVNEALKEKLAETEVPMEWMAVSNVSFITDDPNPGPRLFVDFLVEQISKAKTLVVESPQFSVGPRLETALAAFLRNGGQLTFLDQISRKGSTLPGMIVSPGAYVSNGFRDSLARLIKSGTEFKAKSLDYNSESAPLYAEEFKNEKWGSHNKLAIFDAKDVLVSTYNFEIFSELYNPEMGFFFPDAFELARLFKAIQDRRIYK